MKTFNLFKISILFFAIFSFTSILSQEYKSAVGIRGGFYKGGTIKHFISSKTALEGLLLTRYNGINLTGLIEFHNQAFKTERLKWYYGFGGHVGLYNSLYYSYYTQTSGYGLSMGVDGIIGLEYTLEIIPLNIGIDWKPRFNLYGGYRFGGDSGALSIRYCFE